MKIAGFWKSSIHIYKYNLKELMSLKQLFSCFNLWATDIMFSC